MVHQAKDKVFRRMIRKYPQEYLIYSGKNYVFLGFEDSVVFGSIGEESRMDIAMKVLEVEEDDFWDYINGLRDMKDENGAFLFNNEIQSTLMNEYLIRRSHNYASKSSLEYGLPVESFVLSTVEPKSRKIIREIAKGEKFTIDVATLTEKDADKAIYTITKKIENKHQLNPYDLFDLIFLPYMTSNIYNQKELYVLSVKLTHQAIIDPEDKEEIMDLLEWSLDDFIKTEKEYMQYEGDLMGNIHSRFVERVKEESLEKGIKIGEEKGIKQGEQNIIINLLKEFKDIDYIQQITRYPRSEIENIAKIASINIKI